MGVKSRGITSRETQVPILGLPLESWGTGASYSLSLSSLLRKTVLIVAPSVKASGGIK